MLAFENKMFFVFPAVILAVHILSLIVGMTTKEMVVIPLAIAITNAIMLLGGGFRHFKLAKQV